ncbi:hypothetical protein [Tropicimonas sp. IMCC34043]|uniref:hypothetical protein n=1 Tax=Tropicimonas sp. IMCC34043 TaxID=2248760 RepID=UPI001300691C|nr:hypothetical protein [Tropicimonas sp. IMCC34043]
MSDAPRFRLQLMGTLGLIAPSGRDVTPKMAKTRGILAYLALSEEKPISRATLQDLFWSDRMPRQGRDSLKKALSELRRCFDEAAAPPLESTGGPVVLRQGELEIDLFDGSWQAAAAALHRPLFLDGLNIVDPAFVCWRDEVRQRLDAQRKTTMPPVVAGPLPPATQPPARELAPTELPASGPPEQRRRAPFSVGVLPPACLANDLAAVHFSNAMLDALQRALIHSGMFEVQDFRPIPLNGALGNRSADLLLTCRGTTDGDVVSISMQLGSLAGNHVVWTREVSLAARLTNGAELAMHASAAVDQISEKVGRFDGLSRPEHVAARNVLTAIDHIYRLTESDLEAADAALGEAISHVQTSPFYAWRAFLAAFQVEKFGRTGSGEILDRAEFYSERALELDRHNPLALALVAHVQSFVFRDTDRAQELVSSVRDLASQNVMLADTFSMLHFYTGDYDSARRHAETACRLARSNPFRYTFTTSLAMSQLMLGNHRDAATSARQALAQHPVRNGFKYEPTLRTLAAACSWSGDLDAGRAALLQLDGQSGRRTLDRLANAEDAPFPNSEVLGLVRRGLEVLNG